MNDPSSTGEILRRLSVPGVLDARGLSRRRFLQAALGVGAFVALESQPWLRRSVVAAPLAPDDGVLIVVLLAGGNDGLNTVAPVGDPAYRSLRGGLAIDAGTAHPIGNGFALHPALGTVKQQFDAGRVAVLHGVGLPDSPLSHFDAMRTWMAGGAGGSDADPSGWVGRYLSSLAAPDTVAGVVFGDAVPLHFQGPDVSAVTLARGSGDRIGWLPPNASEGEVATLELLSRFSDRAHSRGQWADRWNGVLGDLKVLGARTGPIFAGELPAEAAADFALAARLVNLDIGTRAIGITLGGFDTHANQAWTHGEVMRQFDAGIAAFFAAIDPRFAGRVTILTVSEFGRRPRANGSGGTDHGAASSLLAIGQAVQGGHYGTPPSLGDLDGNGNLRVSTDFRSVYATALRWLGGNAGAILGGGYDDLGFLTPATAGPGAPSHAPGNDVIPGGRLVDTLVGPTIIVSQPSVFVPMAPARVLDTRSAIGYTGPRPAEGTELTVALAGQGGLPASGLTAVVLNVTVAESASGGFVTAWPGGPLPNASNVNLDAAGQTRPNLVSAAVGVDGAARLYTSTSAHLIADVSGYYRTAAAAAAGRFVPRDPSRLLDTRGGGTIGYSGGKPRAGDVVTLAVAGRAGVPATGAGAVVLNVTVTDAGGDGYVTVYPDGAPPNASNLNVQRAGQTIANQVIVRLGGDGAVRLFTYGSAHLLADIVGWFTDDTAPVSARGMFTASTPYRVLDTRAGSPCAPGSVTTLPVATAELPAAGASAVVLNVAAVDAHDWGYVTVFPAGDPPEASNVNVDGPGLTIANHVVCPVGPDGALRLYTSGETHLIADVIGWFV